MNRNPVAIVRIIEDLYLLGCHVGTRKYYQVFSGSLDACGHEHRTKKEAAPCLKVKQKAYAEWRSNLAKRAWAKRRGEKTTIFDLAVKTACTCLPESRNLRNLVGCPIHRF